MRSRPTTEICGNNVSVRYFHSRFSARYRADAGPICNAAPAALFACFASAGSTTTTIQAQTDPGTRPPRTLPDGRRAHLCGPYAARRVYRHLLLAAPLTPHQSASAGAARLSRNGIRYLPPPPPPPRTPTVFFDSAHSPQHHAGPARIPPPPYTRRCTPTDIIPSLPPRGSPQVRSS